MLRKTMAPLVLLAMMSGGAQAQMDCDKAMTNASEKIARMKVANGKRVALTRMALQGYDYCMAGDTFNADKFFKMLELGKN